MQEEEIKKHFSVRSPQPGTRARQGAWEADGGEVMWPPMELAVAVAQCKRAWRSGRRIYIKTAFLGMPCSASHHPAGARLLLRSAVMAPTTSGIVCVRNKTLKRASERSAGLSRPLCPTRRAVGGNLALQGSRARVGIMCPRVHLHTRARRHAHPSHPGASADSSPPPSAPPCPPGCLLPDPIARAAGWEVSSESAPRSKSEIRVRERGTHKEPAPNQKGGRETQTS